jgi:hypothetical protein
MRDERDRTIYYLFFASNHPLGHIKMKEAFWRMDPRGDFKFSDATNPNQLVLFEVDPSCTLAEMLCQEYLSKKLSVEQIQSFVENQTPFLARHMRSALKLLEQSKQITVEPLKRDGKKRKRGTFPENVIVEF